jgi:hypothetical protein
MKKRELYLGIFSAFMAIIFMINVVGYFYNHKAIF